MNTRSPTGLAMLAAWLNVRVDQIPPENRAHLNPSTMESWGRVEQAAIPALCAHLGVTEGEMADAVRVWKLENKS